MCWERKKDSNISDGEADMNMQSIWSNMINGNKIERSGCNMNMRTSSVVFTVTVGELAWGMKLFLSHSILAKMN